MGPLSRRFWNDTSAAAAIEYGLIAGMIACAIIGTLQNMGAKVSTKFGKIGTALN